VSFCARRACAAAEMRRGLPKRSQRRRSRTNASTNGSSRKMMTKLRRQRFTIRNVRNVGYVRNVSRNYASGVQNLPQDGFLNLPHFTALAGTVFGVIVTKHVQRAVNRQPG